MSSGSKIDRQSRKQQRAIAIAVAGPARPAVFAHPSLDYLRHVYGQAVRHDVDERRLFLWLPVFFGAGVLAYFSAEGEPSLLAPLIAFALTATAAVLARRHFWLNAVLIGCCAIFLGFAAGVLRTNHVATPRLTAPGFFTITGTIESIDWTLRGGRLILHVSSLTPDRGDGVQRVRLTFRGRPAIVAGQTVSLKARLSPPPRAAMPGGYDFAREAYFQRLGAVGFSSGAMTPAEVSQPAPLRSRLVAFIDRGRTALTERIITVVGGSTGAIAAALITGKRGQIAEADNENFRAAGIYHIVSISGLHMVLAAGLFFWIARMSFVMVPGLALRAPIKKWSAVIAMIGATFYDVFSGSEVATERSLIMTLVMFGAVLFDRPALAMRNLAIAALIVMAAEPETLLGPSFQMSFGAVAGLMAYGEIHRRWALRRPPPRDDWMARAGRGLWHFVLAMTITSFVAGLATAPFQSFHFHRLNPFGVLGNLLAIPLCELIVMPSSLLGILLYPFGLDAPVWSLVGWGVRGIQSFAEFVAQIPGSVVTKSAFGPGALLLFTLSIAALTISSALPLRVVALPLAVLALVLSARKPLPDIILAPEGNAVLLRSATGEIAFLGKTLPRFAMLQWLPAIGDTRQPDDPSLRQNAHCDPLGCTGTLADGRVLSLVLEQGGFEEDCRRAAIIVTPLQAPAACWEQAEVFDKGYFESYGATLVRLSTAGLQFETARNARFDRPWSPKPGASNPATEASPQDTPEVPATDLPVTGWDSQAPD